MKHGIIVMSWVTALLAVIAIPVVNMVLVTTSASILFGMVVGLVASTMVVRFTVFEEGFGWAIGVLSSVVCAYYVWNSLPAIIQTL